MSERRVLVDGLGFAEGPRWRGDSLWISDIAAQAVLCLDEAGRVARRLPTPGRPSGLGWLADGRLLTVLMDERVVLRYEADEWIVHADLSEFSSAPMNDVVVSESGVAYVTGLGYDAETEDPRPTNIILVHPDGSTEPQPDPLWRPNGCVITPDGSRLIVAEARVHRLTRFRIDDAGRLSDPEEFATLPRGTWADGICLDAEGCVWVADPKGRACRRVNESGEILATIDTSPTPCIACALGGRDGRTLFLLLSELGEFAELAERRQARIEMVDVQVPGVESP
jgi:sugar lactone lactonase YvrE